MTYNPNTTSTDIIDVRRVVQSPLELSPSHAGVSTLAPIFATSSQTSSVSSGTGTPTGRVTASWLYVPATISVQHVRFAYSTRLPSDIVDVRVGIWNSSQTNVATSVNLVNATSSGNGSNAITNDNSRFQTVSGVTVQSTQGSTSSTLNVVCTSGRLVINMAVATAISGLAAGTTITGISTLSGVTNGYQLTLSAATTVALTAGTAITFAPNAIIDTRRGVIGFNIVQVSLLPSPYAAFSSAVSLSPGWYLAGVWNGGSASAASPTLNSSAFNSAFTSIPMVDPTGPSTTPGSNNFKIGSLYSDGVSLSSGVLPTFATGPGSSSSTLYLDLMA